MSFKDKYLFTVTPAPSGDNDSKIEWRAFLDDTTNQIVVFNDSTSSEVLRIGGVVPNNPYDFYLDGTVATGGDGSIEKPFKTITELNNAILLLPVNSFIYTAYVYPDPSGYGNEVVGTLNIAENLCLLGNNAVSTTINCLVKLTSTGLGIGSNVITYKNIAFNNTITLDLTLSTFAFISCIDGQFNINRIDNNPSGNVNLSGGILGSVISGSVTFIQALIFANITINPGAYVYSTNSRLFGGNFIMTGNSTLKTLGTLNPVAGYVDGTVDGSGTPTWLTDAASDAAFTGTVNKTVY